MNPDHGEEGQDMSDTGAADHHRRKDDYAPVEIARLSNGAKRNALIQTVTLVSILLTMFGTFVTLIWFAAGLKSGQQGNAELAMRAIENDAATRARVRAVEETLGQTAAALERTVATQERIVVRLDDTRDRVIRVEEQNR